MKFDMDKALASYNRLKNKMTEVTIDFEAVRQKINEDVKGQEHYTNLVIDMIRDRSYKVKRDRPLFSMVLGGMPSTGKTYFGEKLTEHLFSDKSKLVLVNCGDFTEETFKVGMVGASKQYAGGEGYLTKEVNDKKKGVIIFDEIEKVMSNPNSPVKDIFYGMLDKGEFTDVHNGVSISVRDFVIIFTTNKSQEDTVKLYNDYGDDAEALSEKIKALYSSAGKSEKDMNKALFADALCTRIDLITTTAPLTIENKFMLIEKMINDAASGYNLSIDRIDHDFMGYSLQTLNGMTIREFKNTYLEKSLNSVFVQARRSGLNSISIGFDGEKVVMVREDV